ncbi:hypothetical protein [Paenibacillus eucommiae]|uniref:DUF3937 domain-containing protein n=1 Tax=Paenibacillus eucommiae TaxID=1355755 RepID=A0ABS4IQV3_9BACL|nr:hypothetical protein [Paenibacillus eucommiae]MBP1989947.1 hypothetical protein [Paenibacillus eucommiae]
MKAYVYVYSLIGVWFCVLFAYLPNSKWFELIARNPWGFIRIDAIILVPVLIGLFIADRSQPPAASNPSDSFPEK